MASQDPTLGLVLHSNFARNYAAARREMAIGHAENTMNHIAIARAMAVQHWSGIEEHLAGTEERGWI